MRFTAAQIAEAIGGTVEGDAAAVVTHLASLDEAKPGDLTFLSNVKYASQLAATKATAAIVPADFQGASGATALIRVANPDKAFALGAALIAPPPPARLPGVHPTAVVAPTAVLGKDVHVGAYTVIEAGAKIGDNSVIEAQCFIGEEVEIGEGAHIYPQVTIRERTRIGRRFIAHSGVRIAADGFGYTVEMLPTGPSVAKIPQLGIVSIGDDVEIGANTCIDRARFGETRIGNFVKIDNLVQIGHNVHIGDYSGVYAQAGVAGSTTVGTGVRLWSQSGTSGHIHVADGAQVGPQCGVTKDVPAGAYVIGSPEMSMRQLAAMTLAPEQIQKLRARVKELEKAVAALKPDALP